MKDRNSDSTARGPTVDGVPVRVTHSSPTYISLLCDVREREPHPKDKNIVPSTFHLITWIVLLVE